MLCGDPPFVADDPMELYQQILRGSFVFPASVDKQPINVGKAAKEIVTKLLVANPAMRLGIVKRGHRDLTTHAFFKLIDLNGLVKRTGKPAPPHVPKIANELDMSNFDEMEDQALAPQDPAWAQPCNRTEQELFNGFSV